MGLMIDCRRLLVLLTIRYHDEERFTNGPQKDSKFISALDKKTTEFLAILENKTRSLSNSIQELCQALTEDKRVIEEHAKDIQNAKRDIVANKEET